MLKRTVLSVGMTMCLLSVAASDSAEGPVSRTREQLYQASMDGYTYTYSTQPKGDGLVGVINIVDAQGDVIYAEKRHPPAGGCPGAMQPINHFKIALHGKRNRTADIVALCGSDSGHSTTLTIFLGGRLLSHLNFSRYEPNLEVLSGVPAMQAQVIEELQAGQGGLARFLVVYRMSLDGRIASQRFVPWFGRETEEFYRAFYAREISRYSVSGPTDPEWSGIEILEPALAALAATQNTDFICAELRKEPWASRSPERLAAMKTEIQEYGYPEIAPCVLEVQR